MIPSPTHINATVLESERINQEEADLVGTV